MAPTAPDDTVDIGLQMPISHNNQHIDGFFERNGFHPQMRIACESYAQARFPHAEIRTAKFQGYCSYTLAISTTHLLQFRPASYKLDTLICDQARVIFGALVSKVKYLGSISQDELQLHIYLQDKIPGVTLAEFRRTRQQTGEECEASQRRLVEDLAGVFALGFQHRRHGNALGTPGKGPVGSTLRWRLRLLERLPGKYFRAAVAKAESAADAIESSPWCLTHGDLIPTNIMVDPVTGHLTGLIDWAEGEWLPFGVGLYGLEEALGYDDHLTGFQFYGNHEELRSVFWDRLLELMAHDTPDYSSFIEEVLLSRMLGVLLWRGIAFDDGRINRAFKAGRDDVDLQKLSLLLSAGNPINGKGRQGTLSSMKIEDEL
ncbi:Fc.00g109490.m01.CDS01 [Cosmosporella sp. VM-42]